MAGEIKSPNKKPPKQTGDLFLTCFGCGMKTMFKNKANTEGKRKVARGRGRGLGLGPGQGIYWSIGKSTASTVPVEAAAAAIVAVAKTAVESDKSGVIRRFGQRRLEQAISTVATDGHPPEATQEKRRDEPGRKESGRKKRTPLPPPPPPPPAPVIRTKPDSGNQLDPIVGMSIVLVTLMVLVSWGQMCAILCTAAWLYVLPRLRPQSDGRMTNKGVVEELLEQEMDYMSSEEYKKKVVLEGLLQRNHRKNSSLVMST